MTMPFADPRSRRQLGWTCMALVWATMLLIAVSGAALGDEVIHQLQIQRFLAGDFRVMSEYLTNVPGYHWLMTGLLWVVGSDALTTTRAFNAVLSASGLVAFYLIRRQLHPQDARRATAQLLFLPVLLPFWFLAYTDALALALLLCAAYATLRARHGWAGIAIVASMAIRQNNVFWAGFLALMALWPLWQASGWRAWRVWRESFVIAWPYGVAVLIFLAYWAWHGSISYSAAQGAVAHPDLKFDAGNPFFLLFLAGVLLPLQVLARLRRFVRAARARPWLWVAPLLVFGLFAWLFAPVHPYNTFVGPYFPRNTFLQEVARHGAWWWIFGVVATLAACGLATTRFTPAHWRLAMPLGLLFVSASWMIETRYTFVPLTLFLAFRVPEADPIERATLAWWVLLCGVTVYGIFGMNFFL